MFLLGDKVGLAFIVPLPFYMMELLIGIVQALVFMLLVAVYIGLICNHPEEEEH
jgi:F-type H+-transporting ATPase subunit a